MPGRAAGRCWSFCLLYTFNMGWFCAGKLVPVGLFVNLRFAQRYEAAECGEDYEVYGGLVKLQSFSIPLRRPLVYRDSFVELG
ncbi:hypothetical protein ASPBRDRAFT_333605 [Aspergillus brasiliensis CBS 101740]|uniref:Uncharacterized protein n=1 Tax=Aspergillus brasiliensis (strain CBS 101740 / IMI 381727 / IBT 21946) TaxID=767769 RepID=A0A1L9U7T5_ASPBC|nr:hypothetical protein ASPBRDRAFT_333605 [Aspergillus brasiliensis CBS 101740]